MSTGQRGRYAVSSQGVCLPGDCRTSSICCLSRTLVTSGSTGDAILLTLCSADENLNVVEGDILAAESKAFVMSQVHPAEQFDGSSGLESLPSGRAMTSSFDAPRRVRYDGQQLGNNPQAELGF